jgi:FKBP-type peptidyl-prolyl cis-trans isomerase (trigger factor)
MDTAEFQKQQKSLQKKLQEQHKFHEDKLKEQLEWHEEKLKEQHLLHEEKLKEQLELHETQLREGYDRMIQFMGATIDNKFKQLEAKERYWSQLQARMQENAKKPHDLITLNVGGTKFMTTKSTLIKMEGSYFHAMLASGDWLPNEKGKNDELFYRSLLNRM